MELKEQKSYEQLFFDITGQQFNKFYAKYYNKLVWHIQKFKITQLDAEELANEALMQSLEKIKMYNSNYHYSTWLFTIGKNLALQFKNDNKKYVLVDTSGDSNDDNKAYNSLQYYLNSKLDNSTELLESQTISTLKYDETLKEISKLDAKYKVYIELCDIQNKSYNEIAEIMGVEEHTVKNRLFHGRKKLEAITKNKFKKIVEQQY